MKAKLLTEKDIIARAKMRERRRSRTGKAIGEVMGIVLFLPRWLYDRYLWMKWFSHQ